MPTRTAWNLYLTAFVLGLERQWRQRRDGLRTNVLVTVGAAAFCDLGLLDAAGATRIIANVVSGIGFLGAGVILKDGTRIRSLNTAATLSRSAPWPGATCRPKPARSACSCWHGTRCYGPWVNWVNRRPTALGITEARYLMPVVCRPRDVRDLLDEVLERAAYPVRGVETLSDNDEQVELAAVLMPTTARAEELDEAVATPERSPLVLPST